MAAGHTTSITLERIEQKKKRGLEALTAPSSVNLRSVQSILLQQLQLSTSVDDQRHQHSSTSTSRNRSTTQLDSSSSPAADAAAVDAAQKEDEDEEKEIDCLKTMLEILSLEDSFSLLSREVDLRTLASMNDDSERNEDDDDRRNIRRKTTGEGASAREEASAGEEASAREEASGRATENVANIAGFIAPSSQICLNAIRDSWKWISGLVKCIGIHLENSANYHQFFAEFSESDRWMREDLKRIQRIYERRESEANYSDANRLIEELQTVGLVLKQWRSKVDRMWTNAQSIVPVDLRTKDIQKEEEEAIPATALCHYATNEIEFCEDEDLLLLQTSTTAPPPHPFLPPSLPPGRDLQTGCLFHRWRVSNGRGQTGEAPSVIINIRGIDPKAIHAAVQLRLTLLAEWTDILKTSGRHLMAFLLNVFKAEYTDQEMETVRLMREDDKRQLLWLVSCIEDALLRCIWSEHCSDFVSIQRHIELLRRMMMEDDEQQQQMRGLRIHHPLLITITGSTEEPSLVVQIGDLKQLLDAFQANIVLPLRDLWESWNVIRISPQLSGHREIQELMEKWEEQQTANRVYFASFWRSDQTPILEMERTLDDPQHFQIDGIILQSPYNNIHPSHATHAAHAHAAHAHAAHAAHLTTTYAAATMHSGGGAPRSLAEESNDDDDDDTCLQLLQQSLPSPDSACSTDNGLDDDDDESDFGIGTETRTAHTEQYLSTESEERKRFVIRSVVDPVNGQKISLHEAVETGVICHSDGTYVNTTTGDAKSIVAAMKEGLINVMFTTTKRSKEKKSSIGVITVKTIRQQTRPYRIQTVLDTRTGKEMTREEAVERNIIDEGHGTYLNRQTGRKTLIVEAIELGLVSVEYTGGVDESTNNNIDPEVISNTYAVHGVIDRARQKVVTFVDALRRGIVDRETGTYRDTVTGQRMYVGDAILHGYMKAKVIVVAEGNGDEPTIEFINDIVHNEKVFTVDNNTEEEDVTVVVIKPTAVEP